MSDSDWDSFIASSRCPCVFQTSAWGTVVRAVGQEPYRVSVKDENGNLSASALLIRRRTNAILSSLGLNRAMISWGPVANDNDSMRALLQALLRDARKHGIAEIRLTNDLFEALVFLESGFSQTRTDLDHEIVVNTSRPREELWNNLDKDCRSAIRKAERDGVEVFEGSCDDFYGLYLLTRRRLKAKLTPKPFFKAIEDVMVPLDMASFLIARLADQNVAAMVMLRFGGVAWYFEGASDERFWVHRANNLLQWKAMELAVQKNSRLYNLTQAGSPGNRESPAYGLYLFKSQFGGELRPLGNYLWLMRKQKYLGRLIYQLAR